MVQVHEYATYLPAIMIYNAISISHSEFVTSHLHDLQHCKEETRLYTLNKRS